MLIVGLGNPGLKYQKTRHNTGFMFLDNLASKWGVDFKLNKELASFVATYDFNGQKHYLIKPITYMNDSGRAISLVMNYYKLNIKDLFVVYDDMDLETGHIRMRLKGSSGGHNGIKSIIAHVKTEDFMRLRIGIGNAKDDVIDYVLSKFSKKEALELSFVMEKSQEIMETVIKEGIEKAMNKYNG